MNDSQCLDTSPNANRWSFWLWLAAALLALAACIAIFTAWAVRVAIGGSSHMSDAQARIVLTVGEFPGLVRLALQEVQAKVEGAPIALLMDRTLIEKPYWVRRFPAPEDDGYLLFSGVDREVRQSSVVLYRIADGAVIARWDPDWPAIYAQVSAKQFMPKGSVHAARAIHPLLLDDGDIVFNIDGALVRMSPCSRQAVWVLDEAMHHSVERDVDGGMWTPDISRDGFSDNPALRDRARDDALALVSVQGRVLKRLSLGRTLRDNGLMALMLGTGGLRLNEDPIHLNEIQVAWHDSKYWKRGDLLLSMRHMSTVLLYRPSTGRVVWYRTGPWMNQHSAEFVDDHRISVFDNNVVASAPGYRFMTPHDANRVMVFDFDTGQVNEPFAELLEAARPMSISEGRARLLPDGGLFLEETNQGRVLRFTRDRLLWSKVNDYDAERIGVVAWSRYLTHDEAQTALQALKSRGCGASPGPRNAQAAN